MGGRSCIHSAISTDDLYAPDPAIRVVAARSVGRRERKAMLKRAEGWPEFSPGSVNAWLLLVTTKPPSWRDPLLMWPGGPPTLGLPHEGFFYPDPMGFWTEVRRWIAILVRQAAPASSVADTLSVASLLHMGSDVSRLELAIELSRPRVILYLDEEARVTGGAADPSELFAIPDPHRPGTVYQGWWLASGGVVTGKAPQHPASHNFYRRVDMDRFLLARPTGGG